MDIWDSAIMKKGDSGIQGVLSYNSNFTFSTDQDIVSKKYVDDSIGSISGYIKADGTVAMTAALKVPDAVNSLENVTTAANYLKIGDTDIVLNTSGDLKLQSIGGNIDVRTGSYSTRLSNAGLTANRDFTLPDYVFSFPASGPSSGDVLTFDGVNYIWSAATGGVTSVAGTTNRITSTGGTTPVIDISSSYVGQASITTVGTLTAGATGAGFTIAIGTSTVTGVLAGANGGTGVANTGKTITLGGNLTTTGAFNVTFAVPQSTTYTLPDTANDTLAGLGTANVFGANQTISTGFTLTVASDTDATTILGRTRLYSATTDQAMFAHFDITSTTGYALQQSSAGVTELNGSSFNIKRNNSSIISCSNASQLTFADNLAFNFGSTTGTIIARLTTQRISFWAAAPIVQPTTAVAAATFVANTSLIANDTATFDGYTIGQVVKALRIMGLLA